jgi:hypothetical protein
MTKAAGINSSDLSFLQSTGAENRPTK